jgi:hypothetical protein
MTSTEKGKRLVEHVIGYCRVRESIAEARNDRYMKLHWQSVGLVVMEAFYGADYPRSRFCESTRVEYVPTIKPKTAAQLEVMHKPLVRVLRQVMIGTLDNHLGRVLRAYEDVLACGHRMPVIAGPYEGSSVRHRRCVHCPPQRVYKRVEMARRAS